MRQIVYNTTTGRSNQLQRLLSSTAEFLITNRDVITIDPRDQVKLLYQDEKIIDTAISKIYKGLMRTDALKNITLINLSAADAVPPVLTSSWISLDVQLMCQVEDNSCRAFSSISDYRNKIIFDFTKYFSKMNRKIIDSTNFQGRIIRALLIRSYHNYNSGSWLTPTVVYSLTKIYSRLVANRLAKMYNLDIFEQSKIEVIAAVYFAGRCSNTNAPVPPIMGKMDFIKKVDTSEIFSYINVNFKEFGIPEMIETIVKFSPDRLKRLTTSTFFSMNINIASSQLESLLAIEHPAYFCYTVIEALSGSKTSMFHVLKTLNLQKESKELVQSLLTGEVISNSI